MEEMDPLAMGSSLTAASLADEALGSMDNNDLFCTGKVRLQMAMEKSKVSGQPVIKHRNGKVDLGAVLDDPSAREFVCPYCSYSFAYKHVLERHVRQIHEKHLLCTYQCPKCTYSTVRKDQMRSHFSVVHEDFKPFNCSECSFRAPKAFRVTAHIQKNHNGVGAVIHDTNLKPRTVSPPPPEVIMQAKKELEATKKQQQLEDQRPVTIGIDALPSEKAQQVKISFPEIAPKTNKVKVMLAPSSAKKVTQVVTPTSSVVLESGVGQFYCPHCDFRAVTQIAMGDHVVLNHHEAHIARNAKMPAEKECDLCQTKLANGAEYQDHVRKEHPDVVVL